MTDVFSNSGTYLYVTPCLGFLSWESKIKLQWAPVIVVISVKKGRNY